MPAETRFRWARAYIEYYTNLLARANYLHLQACSSFSTTISSTSFSSSPPPL